jgi:hypothetical protein
LLLAYSSNPRPKAERLLALAEAFAAARALERAGSSRATSTPMMAMTTSSSTSVKPRRRLRDKRDMGEAPE